MYSITKKYDQFPPEKKTEILNQIILYFEQERDEKIGMVAAGNLLEFMIEIIGKDIYNLGIIDAKKILESRIEDIKYDIDDLQEF